MFKIMNKKVNQKGFTLIELIVVIAIIAILAAVLLPRFLGFSDSAKKRATQSEARSILTGVETILAEDTYTFNAAGDNTDETAVWNAVGKQFDGTLVVTATNGSFTYDKNGYLATYTGTTSGGIVVTP